MKLLLHTCCAPCSVQCVEALAEEGIKPELYWYNPNIHPFTEYRSRRDSLRGFAEEKNLPLIVRDDYGLRTFIKGVFSIEENEENHYPGRCAFCYRLRLEYIANYAAENGYDAFSTTLLISPYQNHELLRQTGEELAGVYHLGFFYRDFRPRYRLGREQAREAGYYMQKYCGCIYSEEERYLKKKAGA
ncbi:MAG: epoxyqueuosine reductase QueH [Treponema sp.]|nr:epoxyqueuosine reductase QueH [Treponema sp.]